MKNTKFEELSEYQRKRLKTAEECSNDIKKYEEKRRIKLGNSEIETIPFYNEEKNKIENIPVYNSIKMVNGKVLFS